MRTTSFLFLSACAFLGGRLDITAYAQCTKPRLFPGDSSIPDNFGVAARDGETLAVGAFRATNDSGVATGAVYIFQLDDQGTAERADDLWVELDKLTPSGGLGGERFGYHVELAGSTLLVAVNGRRGAETVYFFERHDSGTPGDPFDDTWLEVQQFQGSTPYLSGGTDEFGSGISISGTTALIGARTDGESASFAGAAYVFERDDNGTPADPFDDSWVEVKKLLASDGATWDIFGPYVALQGNTALITAPRHDEFGIDAGVVYVFGRDDQGTPGDPFDDDWVEIRKLQTGDAGAYDDLGVEVEFEGDIAMVGAMEWQGPTPRNGKVAVFHRDDLGTPDDPFDDVWTEQFQIRAEDGEPLDYFGRGLSLRGDRVLIGADHDDDMGKDSGSAYVYGRHDGGTPSDPLDDSWLEVAKLVDAFTRTGDEVGRWVELYGDDAMVNGARNDAPNKPGSVIVFDLLAVGPGVTITATSASISVSAGGSQEMTVQPTCTSPVLLYWTIGSVTGTEPGFTSGGLHVPLLPDFYMNFTILSPNTPPLYNSLGMVFDLAPATMRLEIAPGSLSLAGYTVYHSCVLYDPFVHRFTYASDPISVDLVL